MIRSSVVLKVLFLTFLALHTERKRCSQMGLTPCYSQSQVVTACQNFRSVAPSFMAKVPFLAFFDIEGGVAI